KLGHREADCRKKKTLPKSTMVSLVKKGETNVDIAGKEAQGPNGISEDSGFRALHQEETIKIIKLMDNKEEGEAMNCEVLSICRQVRFRLSVIYTHDNKEDRRALWKYLAVKSQQNQSPWLIAGDFNSVLKKLKDLKRELKTLNKQYFRNIVEEANGDRQAFEEAQLALQAQPTNNTLQQDERN
ncbi:hypothetical protein HAX54_010672, partial [Datura stramonium]|nr:hypothetical protein [Datura stramonium]